MQTRAKIKRGSTEEETGERLDLAALHLKNLTCVVSMMNTNLGGKIDNLGEHLGGKIDNLCERVDAGREENIEGFAILGEKIDGIKEDTGEMTDTLSFI